MTKPRFWVVFGVVIAVGSVLYFTREPEGRPPVPGGQPPLHVAAATRAAAISPADLPELERQFIKTMSGATLHGFAGRQRKKEIEAVSNDSSYRLGEVAKLDDGHWKIEYFIPGTERLYAMPPVSVEWAGETPVIVITGMKLKEKQGTFSARILIDGDRYSGTWSDGTSQGCMFGTIVHEEDKEHEA